jgi:hypothetical protein
MLNNLLGNCIWKNDYYNSGGGASWSFLGWARVHAAATGAHRGRRTVVHRWGGEHGVSVGRRPCLTNRWIPSPYHRHRRRQESNVRTSHTYAPSQPFPTTSRPTCPPRSPSKYLPLYTSTIQFIGQQTKITPSPSMSNERMLIGRTQTSTWKNIRIVPAFSEY